MVNLIKALTYGAAVWLAIALMGWLLPLFGVFSSNDSRLLMIPISVIVVVIGAIEYMRDIHAQYEQEGLELAIAWLMESLALEILVFGFFFGYGLGHFLNIATWLSIAFKAIFPLAAGIYLQHTITD